MNCRKEQGHSFWGNQLLNSFKCNIQCFEHHNWNFLYLHCIKGSTESQRQTSKDSWPQLFLHCLFGSFTHLPDLFKIITKFVVPATEFCFHAPWYEENVLYGYSLCSQRLLIHDHGHPKIINIIIGGGNNAYLRVNEHRETAFTLIVSSVIVTCPTLHPSSLPAFSWENMPKLHPCHQGD